MHRHGVTPAHLAQYARGYWLTRLLADDRSGLLLELLSAPLPAKVRDSRIRFQYPFWWNNLVAALDSVSLIDPTRDDSIEQAVDWLIARQAEDGLWEISHATGEGANIAKSQEMRRWVSLAICRVLSRLSGDRL